MKILFVCTGNTCRSPMAEGLFSKIIESKGVSKEVYTVVSAGLMTVDGLEASEFAVEALNEKGIDIRDHRSKRLTTDMIEEADLILTMTYSHKTAVIQKSANASEKTYTLKEYANHGDSNMDIADPFGMDIDAYQQCAEEISTTLESIVNKLIGEQI
ncbi:MAG: low molecular weight protein arginine phosphatase [Eubacteriales bacterium]|nr:low molecular weight protein arginine phosphatase [Eubacteriales bacterium]